MIFEDWLDTGLEEIAHVLAKYQWDEKFGDFSKIVLKKIGYAIAFTVKTMLTIFQGEIRIIQTQRSGIAKATMY